MGKHRFLRNVGMTIMTLLLLKQHHLLCSKKYSYIDFQSKPQSPAMRIHIWLVPWRIAKWDIPPRMIQNGCLMGTMAIHLYFCCSGSQISKRAGLKEGNDDLTSTWQPRPKEYVEVPIGLPSLRAKKWSKSASLSENKHISWWLIGHFVDFHQPPLFLMAPILSLRFVGWCDISGIFWWSLLVIPLWSAMAMENPASNYCYPLVI